MRFPVSRQWTSEVTATLLRLSARQLHQPLRGQHTLTLTTTLAPGAYNQLNATAIDEAGNPANATTTQTVQVNGAPVITSGAAAARVSEEGLANGVPNSLPAGLNTTNSTSASGTITATDVDGDALTMSLGTPSASLTSGGVAIAWTLQDAGHTLIGKAGMATIMVWSGLSFMTTKPRGSRPSGRSGSCWRRQRRHGLCERRSIARPDPTWR